MNEQSKSKKIPVGIIGVVIGLMAIFVAIFQKDIENRISPPEEQSAKEILFEAGKKLLKDKIQVESAEVKSSLSPVDYIYMILGFIAISIGVISWIKKDHIRISGAAISLGLVAIAWEYVLIAIGVAVIIFILANLS